MVLKDKYVGCDSDLVVAVPSDVRFGICGMGRFGNVHLRHFSNAKDAFKVVALCDHDEERARVAATQFDCAHYSSFEAFLSQADLEFVIIATRSLDHAGNAEQALKAGKTVLLEKPIGVTSNDFQLLKNLVEKYPGKLFFSHNHRFEPAFMNTQAIIQSGILGHIHIVKLHKHHEFMRRNDWQMRLDCGGGQLSVWGPHLIDQALQLLGAPVRDVHSYLRSILTPGDGDDHVKLCLVGENNRVAEVEISNAAALSEPYCTIYGDRGSLIYEQDQKQIRLKYLDPDFVWPAISADAGHPKAMSTDGELPWIEECRPVVPETNMWEQVEMEMVEHLYQALRKDVPFPISSADALEVVRITELVKEQNPHFAWVS